MMSEFTTIAIAKQRKSGNIMFKVISLGELKSGNTKTGTPYQKQDVVIKDSSGAMNLTLWNEHIGLLEPGLYYSLENAWWSDYKGDIQVSLGNYYELEKISESKFVNSTANPNQPTIEQAAKTLGDAPVSYSINESILHELEIIRGCVEPLFKKMVDDQLAEAQK